MHVHYLVCVGHAFTFQLLTVGHGNVGAVINSAVKEELNVPVLTADFMGHTVPH